MLMLAVMQRRAGTETSVCVAHCKFWPWVYPPSRQHTTLLSVINELSDAVNAKQDAQGDTLAC